MTFKKGSYMEGLNSRIFFSGNGFELMQDVEENSCAEREFCKSDNNLTIRKQDSKMYNKLMMPGC